MRRAITIPLELAESLVDDGDCWFDHHGGCQEHDYLTLEPGQLCPQMELKQRLLAADCTPENVESPLARASREVSEQQDALAENVECQTCHGTGCRLDGVVITKGCPDCGPTPDNVEEPT